MTWSSKHAKEFHERLIELSELAEQYDATDSLEHRITLNDTIYEQGKPLLNELSAATTAWGEAVDALMEDIEENTDYTLLAIKLLLANHPYEKILREVRSIVLDASERQLSLIVAQFTKIFPQE